MNKTWTTIAVLAFSGGALFASGYAIFCGSNSEDQRAHPQPAVSPLRVVLGERSAIRHDVADMPRGGRVEVLFTVSNPGPDAVTIGLIKTSCDCFRVELDATRVEAGTEVGGRAVIDFAGEPGFAGGLMLSAEAAAEDGRPVFALKLSVKVK